VSDSGGLDRDARIAAVADKLRIDAATAEVLDRLDAVGASGVLLKGPSITRWLYDDEGTRFYTDCDLLIRRRDIGTAERVLEELRFSRRLDERALPGWWREHGAEWWREADRVLVDLHRTLPGIGVDLDEAWSLLVEPEETLLVAGYPARVLPRAARALHLALHAAHHGSGWVRVLADLDRALERTDESLWRDAARLAERLGATGSLATGLRLTPAGELLAGKLGLPADTSTHTMLRASTPPPVALGFEQLAHARGIRERASIVWWKLFPPAEFVRHWAPSARKSRVALAWAFVRRPFWLLRNAPKGARAWRAARRRVRHQRRTRSR
jgi:hypothetical protein